MHKRRGVDAYVVLWTTAAVALVAAVVLFAILRKPPVDQADITQQAQIKKGVENTEFAPNHPPDFTVKHAEIILSEADGTQKLRLVTDSIIGENNIVGVKEGTASFTLEKGDKLSISAEDCRDRP